MTDQCPECGGDNIEDFDDGALCIDCGFEGDETAADDETDQAWINGGPGECPHDDVFEMECLDCGELLDPEDV